MSPTSPVAEPFDRGDSAPTDAATSPGSPDGAEPPLPPDGDDLRSAMQRDVVELVAELVRIDTSNPGDDTGPGELAAAEYVAATLAEVGIPAEIFTTTSPTRAGVSALIPGTDTALPPLLLTGHLDVVPAVADEWTHPPFSGLIDDEGVIWGRGTVDMKGMVGMILAVVRHWARSGVTPRRSIGLLFTPDEEAGGLHGAHWIVDNRPELLHGAEEAIGEVGGYSVTLPNGRRIYPVQSGEKGLAWVTATVGGTSGHGSLIHDDNPVHHLIVALAGLVEHPFEAELTPAMAQFVAVVEDLIGEPLVLDDRERLTAQVGAISRVLGAAVRTTVNPTLLDAGYKHNIVPGVARAGMDLRFLPGQQDSALTALLGYFPADTELTYSNLDIALETPFEGDLPTLITQVLGRFDPDGVVVPFLMTGGTDAKAFSKLGVRYFGFSPLRLPDNTEFWSLFHAADERVPVSALEFGVEVLEEVARLA
jgi:acetylornithine deacetylase/succinyl-diaminopimelate desuccinylase-like protein